jgi:hypothetical protein
MSARRPLALVLANSTHALDRYRMHYPDAERIDLLLDANNATPMDPDLFRAITQRTDDRVDTHAGAYRLSMDGNYVFVCMPHRRHPEVHFITTALRLHATQQAILANHGAHD